MRSVLLHLAGCTEVEVTSFLAAAYPAQAGPPWVELVDGDPCLNIACYRDHAREFDPAELEQLPAQFSGCLPVSVIAHVSGRHDGAHQVRRLVEALLTSWQGVAEDEHGDLWTLREIRSGRSVDGRSFFRQR